MSPNRRKVFCPTAWMLHEHDLLLTELAGKLPAEASRKPSVTQWFTGQLLRFSHIFTFPFWTRGKDIPGGDRVSCLIYIKWICRGVIYFWCARGRAARPRIKPPLDGGALINQTPGWQSTPCSYSIPIRPSFVGYVVVALLPSTIHCHRAIN